MGKYVSSKVRPKHYSRVWKRVRGKGDLIPRSRFFFFFFSTKIPHAELLSSLSQSRILFPNLAKFRFPSSSQTPYPVNVPQISHCILVKSRIPLTFPKSHNVFWSNPAGSREYPSSKTEQTYQRRHLQAGRFRQPIASFSAQ